jgi:hypothetical protein
MKFEGGRILGKGNRSFKKKKSERIKCESLIMDQGAENIIKQIWC